MSNPAPFQPCSLRCGKCNDCQLYSLWYYNAPVEPCGNRCNECAQCRYSQPVIQCTPPPPAAWYCQPACYAADPVLSCAPYLALQGPPGLSGQQGGQGSLGPTGPTGPQDPKDIIYNIHINPRTSYVWAQDPAISTGYDVLSQAPDGFYITDNGVSGTGLLTLTGAGTRAFFFPPLAAFRAGTVNGSQWDPSNIGIGSVAVGGNTIASASYSNAEGLSSSALGFGSHAEGLSTTAGATGAHAEGNTCVASGDDSHAEGNHTNALAFASHSEGLYNTVTIAGGYSHAEGTGNTISAQAGHAEGQNNNVTGNYSHAEGSSCLASGTASHAEGYNTQATGDQSHAEGSGTTAGAPSSHAEGDTCVARGPESHAEGVHTNALAQGSHTEGSYNTVNTLALYAHAEGSTNTVNSQSGHAEGNNNVVSGTSGHAEGANCVVSASYAHAEVSVPQHPGSHHTQKATRMPLGIIRTQRATNRRLTERRVMSAETPAGHTAITALSEVAIAIRSTRSPRTMRASSVAPTMSSWPLVRVSMHCKRPSSVAFRIASQTI